MSDETPKTFQCMIDRVLNYKPSPKGKKAENMKKKKQKKKANQKPR
jgi:hypothetical protein